MHLSHIRARLTTVALIGLSLSTAAQRPPAQPNAAEILHKMQKLNVLGSVLYIVAHPDDENTRLITWLANGKKVRTGNLSLTRGDGGQNLIGPELGDALGIIRTQELLEARRIDGGEQFFTRAVDFGYSKSAEESFAKWGKQEVLSDVVRVIRMFRPDIIITRFAPDGSGGHGHHTASAILAHEAFDLAGDPNAFPEHLQQGLEVWQPRRLFFNASSWWKKDLPEFVKNDTTGEWFSVDVGGYDPLLGLSYTEIAGRSRSMHKSQGFGAAETRGEMLEYLHLEKGDRPKTKDIFEGIDMTWIGATGGDKKCGQEIDRSLNEIIRKFDATNPSGSVERLSKLVTYLTHTPTSNNHTLLLYWDIQRVILDCLGVSVEYLFKGPYCADVLDQGPIDPERHYPNIIERGELVVQNRSSTSIEVVFDTIVVIAPIRFHSQRMSWVTGGGFSAEPFWLMAPHGNLYKMDSVYIGAPVIGITGSTDLRVSGEWNYVSILACYKWVDRVAGERIRPVYVTPVASVIPKQNIVLAHDTPKGTVVHLDVEIVALTDSLIGDVRMIAPEGWIFDAVPQPVSIARRNERQLLHFMVHHHSGQGPKESISMVRFEFNGAKGKADRTLHEIDYPHIMPQVYYTPAEVKLVPLDVTTTAKTVGYIKGAGDEVPEAIEQLGATIDFIEPTTATLENISKYDAIVVGIRAYNNNQGMKRFNPVLMQYVENGGTVVVQYNTQSRDMVLPDSLIGPYPFSLTRDRVTVEEAPPTLLAKDHALLNTPNKITTADFDGWVQERGLYFCGSLDPHYTPLIAWNDPGEEPLNGGLITCDYGKGRYVYTGISFFRQLPAGVPGAYRLFANLISKRDPK